MNSNQKGKQCPRCRSTLSKTYTQKMICKRCGYTTNKLQVVTEDDAFNPNMRFSKRVNFRQSSQVQIQTKQQENVLQSYMTQFQVILRHLGMKFINENINQSITQRQRLLQTYKKLWFAYLQKMSQQGNIIGGIFTGLIDKSERKSQARVKKEAQKLEKREESDSESQQSDKEENGKMQRIKEEDQQQEQEDSKKRDNNVKEQQNSKKQIKNTQDQALREYKKVINSTVKQLKSFKPFTLLKVKQLQQDQLLANLIKLPKQKITECSFNSLTYLAEKYTWMLSLFQVTKEKPRKQKELLQTKISQKYIRQQDLREFCRERNLPYQKRRLYTELTILSYDLLQSWHHTKTREYITKDQHYPYAYLLEVYRQQSNKPAILQRIIGVLQKMSEQAMVKREKNQKKLPELSLKFICALVYITGVINQKTITILEIINKILTILEIYAQQESQSGEDTQKRQLVTLMLKENNLKVRRVKKVSHQLFTYLSTHIGQTPLFLPKWCTKYSQLFNLPQSSSKQLTILTQILIQGHIQESPSTSNHSLGGNLIVNNFSQRFIVIQQPQIVLSSLIIYLKLKFGLDKSSYPYLVNVGDVWEEINKCKGEFSEVEREKVGFLGRMLQSQGKVFGMNGNGEKQLGLLKLLRSINGSYQPLNTIQQLKYLSNKPTRTITSKISTFKNLVTKKQQNYLSLMYNLNSMRQQQHHLINKPVTVKLLNDDDNDKLGHSLLPATVFADMRLETKTVLNSNLFKAIDYLQDKKQRFERSKNTQNQQKDKQEDEQNNEQKQQFQLKDYLDKPQAHYQIVYHPTINNLYHLGLKQLLLFSESLALVLNGEYSDCRDLLEWVGFLEAVLKEFEN